MCVYVYICIYIYIYIFIYIYILRTLKRTSDWIGYILHRNCLLKHINEVNLELGLEVTGKQGRRRKQLLDDLKETRR